MTAKEKIIGILIVLLGALPYLLKIKSIGSAMAKYTFILPGQLTYQIILVVLGAFLIIEMRNRQIQGTR
jgi:hypothetical protein